MNAVAGAGLKIVTKEIGYETDFGTSRRSEL